MRFSASGEIAVSHFKCRAVIFDLDGVLVDSAACIEFHWQQWAATHCLDIDEVLAVSPGRPTIETIKLVAPHLDVEAETVALERNESVDTNGVYKIEGAAELVRSLPVDRWAIATSGILATATTRIMHTGLTMPDTLVTADDVERGKPDPEPYLLAAGCLGIDPQDCVVIEDAPAGIQAGLAAGMRVIAVESTHPPDALGDADAIVPRLQDIRITVSDNPTDRHLVIDLIDESEHSLH
jgi:sugar-phosphatase